MSRAYLDALARELATRGISGRLRRRILAEVADHLAGDAGAEPRFGDPALIAQQLADQAGGVATRRASLQAFGALAAAGLLYAGVVIAWSTSGALQAVARSGQAHLGGGAAAGLLALAPQVSFVAGTLAAVRALRMRRAHPMPAAVVRILRRRTAVALVSGLLSVAGLMVFTIRFSALLPAWSGAAVLGGGAAAAALLLAGCVPIVLASRVHVAVAGDSGDLADDLGPLLPAPLRGRPWALAGVAAAAVGLAVFVPGLLAADGYDGALRGLAEAAACLCGFAILGRYLGLRR